MSRSKRPVAKGDAATANPNQEKSATVPAAVSPVSSGTPSSPPPAPPKSSTSLPVLIASWLALSATLLAAVGNLYAEGYLEQLGIDHDQLVRPAQAYIFKVLYLIDFVLREASLSQGDLLRWIGMSFAVILGAATVVLVWGIGYDWLKARWGATKRPVITLSDKVRRGLGVFGVAIGVALLVAYTPIVMLLLIANVVAPAKLGAASAQSSVTKFIASGGCAKKVEHERVVARCARLINTGENGIETELLRGSIFAASEKFVVFLAEIDRPTPTAPDAKAYEIRLVQMKDTMSIRRDVLTPLKKAP